MDFPVAAIGALAGALDAFKKFFNAPKQNSMAFVIVGHPDPEQVSHLPALLRQHTTMEAVQALDGEGS